MNIPTNLLTTGALTGVSFLTDKAISKGWEAFTGRPVPKDDEETGSGVLEVMLFAAASAAVVALVQYYAKRGTNRFIANRQG